MSIYNISGMLSASTLNFEVEADSIEEALEQFYDSDVANPSMCYHCAKEVEIGDMCGVSVLDEEFNSVLYQLDSDDRYKKKVDKLLDLLEKFCTKSNGLSAHFRGFSLSEKELTKRIKDLYEFQCEVETSVLSYREED